MDPGPWTTPVDPVHGPPHGPGPWTTSVDPVHGPPHGTPLAERVFHRMHMETMPNPPNSHTRTAIGEYSNIAPKNKNRTNLLVVALHISTVASARLIDQYFLDYTYLKV